MSKPNLPPLPQMDVGVSGQVKFAYSQEALTAYAEEAVRQALAAQEPVAWIAMVDGKPVDRPSRDRWLMERSAGSWTNGRLLGLALIPEKGDGQIPR